MTDETTPLSIIPNPFPQNGEKLLSDWPDELVQRRSYRPRPIDPEILGMTHIHVLAWLINESLSGTMNIIEKIGYAPKPPHMDKQQLPYILPDDHPRYNVISMSHWWCMIIDSAISNIAEWVMAEMEKELFRLFIDQLKWLLLIFQVSLITKSGITVIHQYDSSVWLIISAAEDRQAEIQKYNKTNFVGLEPHIPNTYCNRYDS